MANCFPPLGTARADAVTETKAINHDQPYKNESHYALMFDYSGWIYS